MAKVKSRVPRGFTRYYALNIINEKPSTGKELIEEAENRSDGEWSPSPGLIYPLLGRLLRDGLINEGSEGRFVITEKGVKALEDHAKVQDQLERQIDLITRLGLSVYTTGKILAEESIDRITELTTIVKDRVASGSAEIQERFNENYKQFLISELEKLKAHESVSDVE
jgi:DNA-binding PadR family transcriptional regulator